ncbi:MlaD family protein [Nocardioides dubius]|uniref:MlaD family protein n=1 Tax=Nocardioides dubius TaxID=317019 RepID=A0ABP4EEP6_9ACTN
MRVLRAHRGAVLGVAAFTVLSLLLTALIAGTLAGERGEDPVRLRAEFRDATGLSVGDDVRMAGVRVGRVVDTRLDGNLALVTFEVDGAQQVTESTIASIAYLNLMGQRYVALEPGARPDAKRLPEDATIPVGRTRPALDLTAMFNAFRPLFDALQPGDLNQLAENIVAVLQGQGGTIEHLTQQVGRLTTHLVDRDALIGTVLDNLTTVLVAADTHRAEITGMIDDLGSLTHGLARDRNRIGGALDDVSALTVEVEDLLDATDDALVYDLAGLRDVGDHLAENAELLGDTVQAAPLQFGVYLRTLGYGSHLNVYVCKLLGELPGLPGVDIVPSSQHSARCR